jgi:hypothetical protein
VIAFGRSSFPLFLHVLGAMVLFGAVLAALILALARRRKVFGVLLLVAVPAYVAMRGGAQWIYSDEGFTGKNDPTWLGIGFGVADAGVLLLLALVGVAFWWQRSSKPVAGRILAALSSVYLVLLAIAWLAMSGKWG